MTTTNVYGRQVVVPLTNKSGGSVAAGDVVVIDTTNDAAFTTTTSASFGGVIGIAQETIANNATGRVLMAGYAALVNVPSSVTRGHYLFTHTVVKQATGSASRAAGAFGEFLTGGTTPTAHIFGITDTSSGAASLGAAVSIQTAGADYTTTSSTYADIDGTNLSLTMTTGAHRVKVFLGGHFGESSGSNFIAIDVLVDGSGLGGNGVAVFRPNANGNVYWSFEYVTAALTAASHTIKLQWKVNGSTGTIQRATTPLVYRIEEMPI